MQFSKHVLTTSTAHRSWCQLPGCWDSLFPGSLASVLALPSSPPLHAAWHLRVILLRQIEQVSILPKALQLLSIQACRSLWDLPPPHSLTCLALFSLLLPGQAGAYPRALACAVEGLFARCLWACSLVSFRSSRPHLLPLTLLACSACCHLTSFMWGLISIFMPQISSHHFIFIHQEGT